MALIMDELKRSTVAYVRLAPCIALPLHRSLSELRTSERRRMVASASSPPHRQAGAPASRAAAPQAATVSRHTPVLPPASGLMLGWPGCWRWHRLRRLPGFSRRRRLYRAVGDELRFSSRRFRARCHVVSCRRRRTALHSRDSFSSWSRTAGMSSVPRCSCDHRKRAHSQQRVPLVHADLDEVLPSANGIARTPQQRAWYRLSPTRRARASSVDLHAPIPAVRESCAVLQGASISVRCTVSGPPSAPPVVRSRRRRPSIPRSTRAPRRTAR